MVARVQDNRVDEVGKSCSVVLIYVILSREIEVPVTAFTTPHM